jgi:hypothetical protein
MTGRTRSPSDRFGGAPVLAYGRRIHRQVVYLSGTRAGECGRELSYGSTSDADWQTYDRVWLGK